MGASLLHGQVVEAGDIDEHLTDDAAGRRLAIVGWRVRPGAVGDRVLDVLTDQRPQPWIDDVACPRQHVIEGSERLRLVIDQGHGAIVGRTRSCEDARVNRPDVVLLDLDGTITDSIPGIFRCLRQALPTIGMQGIDDDELRTWLGPPLRYTLLERYGLSEQQLDEFVVAYRAEYFGGGEYEFVLFPGMAEFISDVAGSDIRLVLATAKPIESAQRVLTRAELIDCFDFVSGTELDLMRQDKPSVIAHGVEGVGLDISSVDAIMVGDRKEDVLGGRHHGFRTVGVRWGYADPGELESVEPTHLVDTTDDLRVIVGL